MQGAERSGTHGFFGSQRSHAMWPPYREVACKMRCVLSDHAHEREVRRRTASEGFRSACAQRTGWLPKVTSAFMLNRLCCVTN